jgi:hypothetical protein
VCLRKPYRIPKIVWTHWDNAELPELCASILRRNKQLLYDWDVRFFTSDEFLQWCQPPNGYHELSIQAKTDFMRLWLLNEYGGVWMDISIVLNISINHLYEECMRQRAELSGFYLSGFTTIPQYPVFESWFIMAPQNSRIIQLWYNEFLSAIQTGFGVYKRKCRTEGVEFQNIFNSEDDTYLMIHLCFQTVIQKRCWLPPHILYRRAEDTMFHIHSMCNWEKECMQTHFRLPYIHTIPYIKLRGPDRSLFPPEFFT